jgi:hypothetical protein
MKNMTDIRAFDIEDGKPKRVSLVNFELEDGTHVKALPVVMANVDGLVPGMEGYTGPIVQANITNSKISGTVVSGSTDPTAVFANSAGANTQATPITITKPTNVSQMHQISVYNPSTVSDLTVKVFTVATGLGGGDRDVLVDTITIPKAQSVTGTTINSYAETIYNWMNQGNGKIQISNNTALGAAEGFTATVRVREI